MDPGASRLSPSKDGLGSRPLQKTDGCRVCARAVDYDVSLACHDKPGGEASVSLKRSSAQMRGGIGS